MTEERSKHLAVLAGLGVVLGTAIGVVWGNAAIGAGVGVALGAGLALLVPLFKK